MRRPCRSLVLVCALMFFGGAAVAETPTAPVAAASAAVLDALRARDTAAIESRFSPTMREALPHDKFAASMGQILDAVGAMGACGDLQATHRNGLTAIVTRCEFLQLAMNVRMAWTDSMQLAGLLIVPVPTPLATVPLPSGVVSESLVTGAEGWPLPATWLTPASIAKPPVVVLVHGSGPNDRDETIGPNRPFLDLALGLAARGIASLRYDKRTRALGERFVAELPNYTLDDEIVDDAVAAVVLASRRNLGPVFIVGHSEGAWLAPRIAAAASRRGVDVAGIVMLAAPLTPVADLIVYQYEFSAGLPTPGATREMVDDVKRRRDNVARLLERTASGGSDPRRMTIADTGPMPLDGPASLWADMGRYDPVASLLSQPSLPALLTFGERDFQVPIAEMAMWQARVGARPKTTIVAFPTLNHLLMAGDGPMSPAEYGRAGHVSEGLVDRVATWIGRESGAGR